MFNFLVLLCSMCIQFASVEITPFDYSSWDNSGSPVYTGLEFLETLTDLDLSEIYYGYFSNNGYGFCYVPLNYFSDAYDDIEITYGSYIVDDNNNVIGYRVTMSNVRSFSWNSNGTYYSHDYIAPDFQMVDVYFRGYQPNNYNGWLVERLNTDYMPYILNNVVFVYNGVLPDDDFIGNSSIGVLGPSGHSQGNPLESLQGFSWTAHSSGYIQSGHNTHVNPSVSTPDYTNATQNLLGQIVDNTNSIIENQNSLGGALETINGNIINGVSAIFNGVSQLNNNFVSSVIIDKEELNDQWVASNTYLAFASMQNSFNLLQSTADDLIDRYSATEDVDELIIPIDLTVWQIESSNYGNFKPFDQVYYMRFGFLDETKALWQPLFIALLYFCLFYGIVLDLPNIIRGVKS